jgi:hypothetical protein
MERFANVNRLTPLPPLAILLAQVVNVLKWLRLIKLGAALCGLLVGRR